MKDKSQQRKCRKCLNIKKSNEFYSNNNSDGAGYYYCKKCASIYGKSKYLKDRNKLLLKNQELKRRIINAYGGECKCCGEKEIAFLTIEHSFKDGKKLREKFGFGQRIYADLEKRNYPKNEGIEINCMNCNWAKRRGDKCPHKETT